MKEILMTKISRQAALSYGISVDKRRRSRGLLNNFNYQRITKFFDRANFQTKKPSKTKPNVGDYMPWMTSLVKIYSISKKVQDTQISSDQVGIPIHAFKVLRERKKN